MEFTFKSRWKKDGHRTFDPTTSIYDDVVSWDIIRIEMTYAALMKLDVMAADIRNAYLQEPT